MRNGIATHLIKKQYKHVLIRDEQYQCQAYYYNWFKL